MVLKDQINSDLKAALLSGDRFKGETLRGLKAVILNEEVATGKRETGVDDSVIERLIAREVKKRNESALIYVDADRSELADNERAEAKIISVYLPKQLSEEEIKATVIRVVETLGISGPSAMGQVIGTVKKELGNSADGALIAKIVKSELS
ncbi:MAG TPA: GatB/YqeY domain-containing protein [Candidatus Saccharimonadales bacterium]|nr:GatB/YqeY domain-containing protein [Candidatus Saccharimonadales bacterium]